MRLALVTLLLTGCSTFSFTERKTSDIECGLAGPVQVVVRDAAWTDCPRARGIILASLEGTALKPGWTAIFSDGFAGFELDRDMHAFTPKGVTYVGQRIIVLEAGAPGWVVSHELGHADDVDHGRPNTRDF